jgi:hypothetical protein
MTRLTLQLPFVVFIMLISAAFYSCATVGIESKRSSAWNGAKVIKNPRTVRLGVIISDRAGSSLQQEIAGLLPLLFLEKHFVFPKNVDDAEFVVDVFAAEHDYKDGFEIKKSITMEVLLWPNYKNCDDEQIIDGEQIIESEPIIESDDDWLPVRDIQYKDILTLFASNGSDNKVFRSETPLAAARTVATGSLGYVSAKNTEALLRKTVRRVTGIAAKIKKEKLEEIRGK